MTIVKILNSTLEGLASYGVVFVRLIKNTKRPTRTWDYFEELHNRKGQSRLDCVEEWLNDGYGVGYLLRGGLGVIDADSQQTIQRIQKFESQNASIRFSKVWTPSGGLHAIFKHDPSIDMSRLKNHICHPEENGIRIPWDFKLGERTMLVAAGTVNAKGTYLPDPWITPPIVDIRNVAPNLKIYRDQARFLTDQRPIKDRKIAAMVYLKCKAPICTEGKGARRTLLEVASHVVAYYGIDPSLAYYLMTTTKGNHVSWNDRCLGKDGNLYPWDRDELMDVLEDAVTATPSYGVYLYKRQQDRQYAKSSANIFMDILTFLPYSSKDIWITPEYLYRSFLEYFKVNSEFYGKKEFGCEMTMAIANGRLPFVRRDRTNALGRIYRGMDQNTLAIAIATYEHYTKVYPPIP